MLPFSVTKSSMGCKYSCSSKPRRYTLPLNKSTLELAP